MRRISPTFFSSSSPRQMHLFPLVGCYYALVVLVVLLLTLPSCIVAEYLAQPQFTNRWDTNEPMLQENGITGSTDGRVFATFATGSLRVFSPLAEVQPEPVVFTPSPWVDEQSGQALGLECKSSVVLKETTANDGGEEEEEKVLYAVYTVIDSTADGQVVQSRLLGVNPDTGTLLWFFVLEGSEAVGTPVVGQDYIYVIHNNVAENAGRLTLIQVSAAGTDYQVTVVDTFSSTTGVPWGPISVAAYPQDDETWREAAVWGDMLENGRSRTGSTHLLKVGIQRRVLQTLSDFTGSTATAPALGQIRSSGNDQYDWNVATGNYNGLVHVWAENSNVDWDEALSSREPTDSSFDPTWWEMATSFTTGQFPMQVSPVFSASETFVFVAGAEGGLSAWGADRGRRLWEIPTLVHASQPLVHVPPNLSNNNPAVLYACDARGTIRQIQANNRGTLNWVANYCEENALASCPGVSASLFVSKNGNRLYMANEEGSIFGARVASFETPAPNNLVTSVPTTVPTIARTSVPTSAPLASPPGEDGGDEDDGGDDGNDAGQGNGNNEDEGNDQVDRDPNPVAPVATSAPSPSPVDPNASLDKNALKSDESSSSGLYIVLGIVIFALVVCVGGAGVVLKRRRKNKQMREREIQDEMAAVHRWKSSKKMYEQEMRDEEEATMQELSHGSPRRPMSSDESEVPSKENPLLTTPPPQEKGNRPRSRSRGHVQTATPGTLGSISESLDEGMGSPADIEAGPGVEVTVVDMETDSSAPLSRNLAVAFSASNDTKKKPETPSKEKFDSPAEQLLNEPDPGNSENVKQSTAEPTKEGSDVSQKAEAKTARRIESKPSSSSYQQEDERSEIQSQLSGVTEEPGLIKPYIPPPATSPPDIHTALSTDDDKSDMQSLLSGLSAQSQTTEEPGAIATSPKRVHYLPQSPCSSDLMSVDSSLYLDDNTAASPVPPSNPRPINKPEPTPPTPAPRMSLEPPEGASVVESPVSAKSVDSLPSEQGTANSSVMMPALSVASDETAKRSNSKERPVNVPAKVASTKVHARMIDSTPVAKDLYAKPAVVEASPQTRGRTRAGLFSRNMRREPAEHSSSSTNQSSNMSYSEWSESVSAASSTNEEMKIVGKASANTSSRAMKKAPATTSSRSVVSAGARPQNQSAQKQSTQKQSKPKAKKSRPKEEQGDEENPWNSFLNQLAKVEEEFFNPTLPTKSEPAPQVQKTQRQYGRKRSGKPSFPAPLPPSSQTDIYFKKKEDGV